MVRALWGWLLFALVFWPVGEARADTRPARVRLEMAASPCIDSTALGEQINRVLGRAAISGLEPDYILDVSIEPEAHRARIMLREVAGASVGARTLELESGGCLELLRPLPFIIGMLLDLHASDAILHAPREEPEVSVTEPSAQLGFALGVGALTGYGADAIVGISLSAQLQIAAFLIRLDVEGAPYAEIRFGERGSNLSLLGARLGIGTRLEVGPAAIELDVHFAGVIVRASGHGFTENHERWGPLASAGLRVGFTLNLDPSWFLGIDFSGDARIVRQTFVFMDADGTSTEAFSTAPMGLSTFFRGGAWIDL